MAEFKTMPIWEEEAKVEIWFDFEKYWWNCKCSEFTIYSNNGFETEEGAIKDWNDFCETHVTLYADGHRDGYIDGYIKGYDDGYEKGWQAND